MGELMEQKIIALLWRKQDKVADISDILEVVFSCCTKALKIKYPILKKHKYPHTCLSGLPHGIKLSQVVTKKIYC